jgi:hypothetical protein
MAKSKNHTSHNQSVKAHKNGAPGAGCAAAARRGRCRQGFAAASARRAPRRRRRRAAAAARSADVLAPPGRRHQEAEALHQDFHQGGATARSSTLARAGRPRRGAAGPLRARRGGALQPLPAARVAAARRASRSRLRALIAQCLLP